MAFFPASMEVPTGLTFTVGTFTWTTGGDNTTATTMETEQISSAPITTTTSPVSL
jgi:hypothetical protein